MDPSTWYVGKSTPWSEYEFQPFDFETLPLILQKTILEQADSDTFTDLICCNKHLSKIFKEIKNLQVVNVNSINLYKRHEWVDVCWNPNKIKRGRKLFPARKGARPCKLSWIKQQGFRAHAHQLDVKCPVLTSEICKRAAMRFLRMESTAKLFSIKEGRILECSPEAFGALLMALRCTSISCATFFSREYFAELNQIKFISLRYTDIGDDELLRLAANSINIPADSISDDGIKQFMKDCASRARNWNSFTFNFRGHPMRAYAIAAQLGVVTFWNAILHEKSALAQFSMEELDSSKVKDKWYIEFEDESYLILELYFGQLTAIRAWTKESIWRLTAVTEEQKNVADGISPPNDKEPISLHYSRFSFNRLRQTCPLTFENITQLSHIAIKVLYLWVFNNLPNLESLVDSFFSIPAPQKSVNKKLCVLTNNNLFED